MAKQKPDLFNKSFQKEWSEKYRYKHIHTGEYCTFEAYVAEFIILRRAEKLNIEKPGYKFWTKGDPNYWNWMKQLNAARALKKKYSEKAVISAINSKEFEKLLVLGIQNGRGWKINPLAEKIVSLYHSTEKEKDSEARGEVETKVDNENKTIRKRQYSKRKSSINQLRNL